MTITTGFLKTPVVLRLISKGITFRKRFNIFLPQPKIKNHRTISVFGGLRLDAL